MIYVSFKNDKDLFFFSEIENFTTKDLIHGERNVGAKSDIARYEMVYRHGGMYLDTDSIRFHLFCKTSPMIFCH